MGKFDRLSEAEKECLEDLLNDTDLERYDGRYEGRDGIGADFAFTGSYSDYKALIMAAVRQVNYNSIDGEVDIADGYINIIEALIYCHLCLLYTSPSPRD